MPEPIFMKLGIHIVELVSISTAYIMNPSRQSVYLYVYLCISLLGNGLVDTFPWQRKIVGCIIFYAVRVVSKGSRLLVVPRIYFLFIVCFRTC
jgi:hypothetical protein